MTPDSIITLCTPILLVCNKVIRGKIQFFFFVIKLVAPTNASCLPGIGVFLYYHRFDNYTMASRLCDTSGAALAHILSEARTKALSKLVQQQRNDSRPGIAYIGLNRSAGHEKFSTAIGAPIDCFLYRAWAPLHPQPARSSGCVAVTTNASWKVYGCGKRLPFVCEVYASKTRKQLRLSGNGAVGGRVTDK